VATETVTLSLVVKVKLAHEQAHRERSRKRIDNMEGGKRVLTRRRSIHSDYNQ
jgi:uncharacterized membrane protein YecN with MAPEG domain